MRLGNGDGQVLTDGKRGSGGVALAGSGHIRLCGDGDTRVIGGRYVFCLCHDEWLGCGNVVGSSVCCVCCSREIAFFFFNEKPKKNIYSMIGRRQARGDARGICQRSILPRV